jgi:hypothetical protein
MVGNILGISGASDDRGATERAGIPAGLGHPRRSGKDLPQETLDRLYFTRYSVPCRVR